MTGTRKLEEGVDSHTEGHLSSGVEFVQTYGILDISADRNFVSADFSKRAGVLSILEEVLKSRCQPKRGVISLSTPAEVWRALFLRTSAATVK